MLCRCGHPREHHWSKFLEASLYGRQFSGFGTGKCHHIVDTIESAGEPSIVVECECREFVDALAAELEQRFG